MVSGAAVAVVTVLLRNRICSTYSEALRPAALLRIQCQQVSTLRSIKIQSSAEVVDKELYYLRGALGFPTSQLQEPGDSRVSTKCGGPIRESL